MSRPYQEIWERFWKRRREYEYWRDRWIEFNELAAYEKMHYADERSNELAWVLEGFEREAEADQS